MVPLVYLFFSWFYRDSVRAKLIGCLVRLIPFLPRWFRRRALFLISERYELEKVDAHLPPTTYILLLLHALLHGVCNRHLDMLNCFLIYFCPAAVALCCYCYNLLVLHCYKFRVWIVVFLARQRLVVHHRNACASKCSYLTIKHHFNVGERVAQSWLTPLEEREKKIEQQNCSCLYHYSTVPPSVWSYTYNVEANNNFPYIFARTRQYQRINSVKWIAHTAQQSIFGNKLNNQNVLTFCGREEKFIFIFYVLRPFGLLKITPKQKRRRQIAFRHFFLFRFSTPKRVAFETNLEFIALAFFFRVIKSYIEFCVCVFCIFFRFSLSLSVVFWLWLMWRTTPHSLAVCRTRNGEIIN